MFRNRFARLLSLLLASVSVNTSLSHLSIAQGVERAGSTSGSCFTGVDYASLSVAQLTTLVERSVKSMPAGMTDNAIALEVGRQFGSTAEGCTAAQVTALIRNMAAILNSLGIKVDLQGEAMASIVKGFTERPSSMAGDGEFAALTATVY
jgi:hypothetical protein